MRCERCKRDNCPTLGLPDSGVDPAFLASHFENCANAAGDRALLAEAEVRALCDDPEALNPWLPEGWAWDAAALRWRGPHDIHLTWDVRLCRKKPGAFHPQRRRNGLVAAMVDAVADVMAAEGL